ncbi:tol-pal system-associated acyl-CoA thioesterase [Pseudemcibacter aquimaris]|uniref:tol-pal system-associated acyl-CoA thioesterase n=1 Tax=Pseudemcibacter aquimaris TaxID=2857064 RepID=UPI0020130F99|nr:tol-pal system-associated acyl-CoA thioesterase [Pseudemcibacter aquimaris]MCC3862183.1 tol-pal system-associated acyl-CoA thioesterase [Pseudemcibacter aquimaris]WDU58936.1 tol-pal system-associated acyl-CoA thioesterase [Pseudemcibacter aquimaris]
MKDKIHHFPIRVYYEDTDIGGVVYYANYLKYMERARSEMLRVLGIDQAEMLDYNHSDDVAFVVKRAEIDFNKGARFDDHLVVKSEITKLGGASVIIKQDITLDDHILVTGMIKIASVGQDGKAKRLPGAIKEKLKI